MNYKELLVVNLLVLNDGCLATCERTTKKTFRVPGNNRTQDLRNALITEPCQTTIIHSTPFHVSFKLTRLLLMSEGGGFSLAKPFRFLNTCSSLSKSFCSITTVSSPFSSSWSNQVSSSSSSARASLLNRLLT